MKGYYKQHFTPKGAYLVIVGDITRAEADAYIEKFFGSWNGNTPAQPQFKDPNKTDGNQVYFVNLILITQNFLIFPGQLLDDD